MAGRKEAAWPEAWNVSGSSSSPGSGESQARAGDLVGPTFAGDRAHHFDADGYTP